MNIGNSLDRISNNTKLGIAVFGMPLGFLLTLFFFYVIGPMIRYDIPAAEAGPGIFLRISFHIGLAQVILAFLFIVYFLLL